ncbi:DUF4360 domain-containing protein [Pararhizobium qamdonense]|uniref:DUF4360 domain-containing protein n=1 Tax=Pararhizobium qamdonense TaxID=3031126 RepID=UPI0023E0D363|nr:DUF4360 domain-containing protein [Pararhizobium qamdonense]
MRPPVYLTVNLFALALLNAAGSQAHAANGCADGTFSSVTSPDGNATSFLFDDFSATAGGSSGTTRVTSTCNLSVPVTKPGGYSVYQVDYRGFVTTQDGQTATIVAQQDGKTVLNHQITGPLEDDVSVGNRVGVSGSDTLELSVVVGATGPLNAADLEAGLFLDTIDFARLGFTTAQSVTNSVDQLARQRQSIMLDLMDTAQNLLGQSQRFDSDSYLSAFGSSDAAAGFNGRWNAGNGVSLLGGAAIVNPNRTDVSIDTLALLAGAARYTTPEAQWRAFGEVGAWGSPKVSANLSRSYLNNDDMVFAGSAVSGSLFNAYGRVGAIYAPDDANEIAFSARVTRSWLDLDGYRETATGDNLFAATVKGGRSKADTVSAEIAWSHDTGGQLDYTVSGAIGRTFASKNGAKASVDWVGDVSGSADDQNFATIGGRVGWKLDGVWKVETSLSATFREQDKPDWNVGGQLKASF